MGRNLILLLVWLKVWVLYLVISDSTRMKEMGCFITACQIWKSALSAIVGKTWGGVVSFFPWGLSDIQQLFSNSIFLTKLPFPIIFIYICFYLCFLCVCFSGKKFIQKKILTLLFLSASFFINSLSIFFWIPLYAIILFIYLKHVLLSQL